MNRSAFRFPQPTDGLAFDGERYVSGLLGDATSGDIQSEHYHRYLFALRFCEGKDVLDIASGEGYGSHCLGQVARGVLGVDRDAEAVDFANAHYLNDRVSFRVGRAEAIPVADHSVDVVVSFETLEHFADHARFASETRRVLRPGGLLVISSPNRTVYTEESGYHNEWHVRELDHDEFLAYLTGHFAHVEILAQRPLFGSVIGPGDPARAAPTEGFIPRPSGVFHRAPGVPHPPFLIGLASDAPLPDTMTSLLHNPALLLRIDAQRRDASDRLTECLARAEQLEAALATARLAHAEREAALLAELTQARAGADEAARLRRAALLSRQPRDRIETLRGELSGARRRNEDLLREMESLRDRLALAEAERDRNEARFRVIHDSTLWRATGPLRRIATRMPSGARRGLRNVARAGWRLASVAAPRRAVVAPHAAAPHAEAPAIPPPPEPAIPNPETAASPSRSRRELDPNWVPPNERIEFVQLRGVRPTARIAVVAHVFYADVWREMAEGIANIPEAFDLFVTLVTGVSDGLAVAIHERFPDAHVVYVDNHGRDIFPFIALIRTGALFGYELICKIHSKRSLYRAGGDDWRKHLIGGVLGSPSLVREIVAAFRADPDLGIVVAENQIFGGRVFWISNEARSRRLFRDIGLNESAFERDFVGGSMYWIRPLILRPLDALRLDHDDFEPEPLPTDGMTAHSVERLVSLLCHDAGMKIQESARLMPAVAPAARPRVHVIANYLPQFHPIPENDAAWGDGFTEWTNVTAARPLFRGHRQPRLPTALGFTDLRLPETRERQADLARRHGITAFSYYYYWFGGRRLLHRPIDEVVASGRPDFPFMLCWANEPWTRKWDGLAREVLVPQDYPPGWEAAFVADIAPIMRDPRYLRLNGRPMLAVYRVARLPEPAASIGRLRAALAQAGFDAVHLLGAWVRLADDDALPDDPGALGLDAYFEFPPHGLSARPLTLAADERAAGFTANAYDYAATVEAALDQIAAAPAERRYRGVMMGWDNTARRGRDAFVFHGATPTNFRKWLRASVRAARVEATAPETAVFVNAWNEWAEGTYLEPDRDFGEGWLEAVASATADP